MTGRANKGAAALWPSGVCALEMKRTPDEPGAGTGGVTLVFETLRLRSAVPDRDRHPGLP
jgi:hypothetical protein